MDVAPEHLVLGRLVTVWATHIGNWAVSSQGGISYVTMSTTIHPGNTSKQFVQFHAEDDQSETRMLHRTPLEYPLKDGRFALPGLVTLREFLSYPEAEVGGMRILVVVRSISAKKSIFVPRRSMEVGMVQVGIFDDTTSSVLKLWEDSINSSKPWRPNQTLLLITNPKSCRVQSGRGHAIEVGIGYSSLVDVDPIFPDAYWLREWTANRTRRDTVCIEFPRGVWDIETAANGPARTLFTISEVDGFARVSNGEFTGKLNLVILGLGLLENRRKGTLCCAEW